MRLRCRWRGNKQLPPALLLDSRPARQRLWDGEMLSCRISFLLRCEVIHAEPPVLVRPGSLGLPARCRSEFVECFYPVLVRIFRRDALAFAKFKLFTCNDDLVLAAADQAHFNSTVRLVINSLVTKPL